MSLSLKPTHLKRYKDVARLLVKYGRSDLLPEPGLEQLTDDDKPADSGPPPSGEAFAADLEKMGPTFIKLGQLLSTRGELLPPPYIEALSRLQDGVEPFSYDEVERIVTEELGVRISKAFLSFEGVPLAAASLGQVHRAVLRDGREVVVKVQRPGIRLQVKEDLETLEELAGVLDKHTRAGKQFEFTRTVQDFKKSLLAELDYRREAHHLDTLADNLAEFQRIVVPRSIADYSTSRVLTMEYIPGIKITALPPVARGEIDGQALAEELFQAYLKQIFVDGFFHADPHPGNVFLADDGRLALLDLGMVSHLSPRLQERLLQMVLAVSNGRADEAADVALTIAERRAGFDEPAFRRGVADVVAANHDAPLEQIHLGKAFLDVSRFAVDAGVRLPHDFTMLGKALLNLDEIGRALAPDFDPNAAIRRHSAKLMNRLLVKSVSMGNMFGGLLEVKDLVERLPSRINRILDSAANNELGLKVDTGIDPALLLVGLQKVANRITVGLVIAAAIVAGAMLMRFQSGFTILGYPGLAMLLLLAAVGGALVLIAQAFTKDLPTKKAAESLTEDTPT